MAVPAFGFMLRHQPPQPPERLEAMRPVSANKLESRNRRDNQLLELSNPPRVLGALTLSTKFDLVASATGEMTLSVKQSL